jgi:hypothetical protein
MPVSPYRYAGKFLAQAQGQWNPQKQNMGMLELEINDLVPGGKETLILSIQEFTIPGREVGTAELPYLNGRVKYPTAPNALGNISATFRDFPETGARRVLHQWSQLVYNEVTGLMLPPSLLKKRGHLVLFAADGTQERSATLLGVWPTKEPEVAINYTSGEHLVMQVDFSVDCVVWDPNLLAPANPA